MAQNSFDPQRTFSRGVGRERRESRPPKRSTASVDNGDLRTHGHAV
jgi:hypothetical protein